MKVLQIYIIHWYPSILTITIILQLKKEEMDKQYDPSN